MARELKALAALLGGALASALGGCVSTDELYAEYDERMCRVAPPALADARPVLPEGMVSLREQVANSYFAWEPAVYFAFDSAALDDEQIRRLERALQVMERYPRLSVALQGFTDRIGSSAYNIALASRRVASVHAWLVGRGVSAERLSRQPLGEGLPVFGKDDAARRAVNRRVELMLLDENGRPLHPLFDFGGAEPATFGQSLVEP